MATPIYSAGVISSPGDYYLANNIVITSTSQLTSGAALLVTAAGVRINTNGCKIIGQGLSPNYPSKGVYAQSTNNFVMHDGQVGGVTGFWCGVYSETPWTRLQELDLSGNFYMGAHLGAHTARLYYNKIDGISGTTNEAYAVGLNVAGNTSVVRGNTIRNLYKQAGSSGVGEGCAIILNASAGTCVVERNWIENDTEASSTIGIFGGIGGNHQITGNNISNFNIGVQGGGTHASGMTVTLNHVVKVTKTTGSVGISADYGLAQGNTILNYATPVAGSVPTGTGNIVYG